MNGTPGARLAVSPVLVIDSYDSFTYNLVQLIGRLHREVRVVRNDCITLDEISAMTPRAIVLSPGPGHPDAAGVLIAAIRRFAGAIPILGVCLGHQAIAAAFGGQVVRAGRIMHGKTSLVFHDGVSVFAGASRPLTATRYHSLLVDRETLPPCLDVSAWTTDGEIMGLRHRQHLVEGIQFHPESFLTEDGDRLIANFLAAADSRHAGGARRSG